MRKTKIIFTYETADTVSFVINNNKVLISVDDKPLVLERCWFVNKKGYLQSQQRSTYKSERLHRLIARPNAEQQVDHIDNNRLNNTRSNLRLCMPKQNQMNLRTKKQTEGTKGVYRNGKRFKSCIQVDGKTLYLGTFDTVSEAATSYDNAAKKYFGEFARPNGGA